MMNQDPNTQIRNQKIISELVKRINALNNDDKIAMWNDAMAWRQTRAANLSNLLQEAQTTVLGELEEEKEREKKSV